MSPHSATVTGIPVRGFVNGDGVPVSSRYQIDKNGKKIAGGKALTGPGRGIPFWAWFHFWQVKVGSKPSFIRFTVDAARTRARDPLSTSVQTTWTWRSVHQPDDSLPNGWVCSPQPPDRHCTVEPMMTLGYHVTHLNLNESAPSGKQDLELTAGHLPLATAVPVTAITVRVSLDYGRTWRHALVTSLGNGRYRAVYTAPPAAS